MNLIDCRITNAVKCLPPENKPLQVEIRTCNGYLSADLAAVPQGGAVLTLGRIAHDATVRALGLVPSRHAFAHGATHRLDNGVMMFDCYHCSRYNTNTGRLSATMFRRVFDAIAIHLGKTEKAHA